MRECGMGNDMNISPNFSSLNSLSPAQMAGGAEPSAPSEDQLGERKAFDQFVGGTFYRQMLGAMQKTVGKPAYFHGGQAEEMFRGQLNQILADKMAEATADQFTGPMFELFQLSRQ
jgi:peptidoglycan hydrolase FlgJ